jgi:hypothetical protein
MSVIGAFERHLKNEQGHQEHGEEIDHGEPDIGHLLAEQEFDAPNRRHVEVADRAKLLFAHDGNRHEDRRKQRQHQRHGMIPKSGLRFSDKIMLKTNDRDRDPIQFDSITV